MWWRRPAAVDLCAPRPSGHICQPRLQLPRPVQALLQGSWRRTELRGGAPVTTGDGGFAGHGHCRNRSAASSDHGRSTWPSPLCCAVLHTCCEIKQNLHSLPASQRDVRCRVQGCQLVGEGGKRRGQRHRTAQQDMRKTACQLPPLCPGATRHARAPPPPAVLVTAPWGTIAPQPGPAMHVICLGASNAARPQPAPPATSALA